MSFCWPSFYGPVVDVRPLLARAAANGLRDALPVLAPVLGAGVLVVAVAAAAAVFALPSEGAAEVLGRRVRVGTDAVGGVAVAITIAVTTFLVGEAVAVVVEAVPARLPCLCTAALLLAGTGGAAVLHAVVRHAGVVLAAARRVRAGHTARQGVRTAEPDEEDGRRDDRTHGNLPGGRAQNFSGMHRAK